MCLCVQSGPRNIIKVGFAMGYYDCAEDVGKIRVPVTRSGDRSKALTLDVKGIDSTAVLGRDYQFGMCAKCCHRCVGMVVCLCVCVLCPMCRCVCVCGVICLCVCGAIYFSVCLCVGVSVPYVSVGCTVCHHQLRICFCQPYGNAWARMSM